MQTPRTREEWDIFDKALRQFFISYGFNERHEITFTSNGIMDRIEIQLEGEAERPRI